VTTSEDPTHTPDDGLPTAEAEGAVENPVSPSTEGDDEAARAVVEQERAEIREFVKELTMDEIKSGNWFTKLLSHSMNSYTTKVDWAYFQDKYKGVPADGIVDQRIKMAARYAAIEGGLSASAYTGAIAATIGSAGGASPIVVPAAVATVMVDVAYITQLQLRLAYDIAVLYRVPLDLSDPDDLWKLIRVAFTIKGGEVAREGVVKVVPVLVRPLIKRFYSKGVLAAAKGLPVVGKFLLQRTVIKVGIPLVGIPLAVLVNRYTTQITGRHARAVFRNEARVLEVAVSLIERTKHPQLMLWVAWLVINADDKIADDEALLMRHLTKLAHERHDVVDAELAEVVELDPESVWHRISVELGDLSDLVDAGTKVAEIDGKINASERRILSELGRRCEASDAS
jgi:tellurite resistance protein